MSSKITYGCILGFVGIALTLVGFLLGLQTDKVGSTLATVLWWIGMIVNFFILWLGVRAVRDDQPDQRMTYGLGVGTGVLIALVGTAIGTVYTFVHFSFINPDFAEHMMATAQQQWADAGMNDRQIEAAEKVTRIFFKPGAMTAMAFFGGMLFNTIFALIIAAIVKRNPPVASAAAPMIPPAA